MTDTYVRLVSLPAKVEGVTLPNDDGSFDIYINSRLSPLRQQETLEHELRHIRHEHFYLDSAPPAGGHGALLPFRSRACPLGGHAVRTIERGAVTVSLRPFFCPRIKYT